MLTVAVVCSSDDDSEVLCVLPVLCVTSRLSIIGQAEVMQPPLQPFYGPFSWVSRCQKRTSGLYGAFGD